MNFLEIFSRPLKHIKFTISTPKKYYGHPLHTNVGSNPPSPGQWVQLLFIGHLESFERFLQGYYGSSHVNVFFCFCLFFYDLFYTSLSVDRQIYKHVKDMSTLLKVLKIMEEKSSKFCHFIQELFWYDEIDFVLITMRFTLVYLC